jgi:hypothetical protein
MPSRRCRAGLFLLILCSLVPRLPAAEPNKSTTISAHWAFHGPVRPQRPAVRDNAWAQTPIDMFVLARLEKAGLRPSPPADRATLLRRLSFDLTGLPPTPAELEHFLANSSPDAYAQEVERLLASPQYGERWAQHWLDVVRYAESNGYEVNDDRPHAWRYRDYVIRAFNDDMPYDRFVTEQLAGDRLAQGHEARAGADLLVAAGFNRCGPVHLVSGNIDPDVSRQEVLTEMTGAIGSVFLGLTLGCARCHDHKFDPLSQRDYYQLQAFFAGSQPKEIDLATPEERAAHDQQAKELERRLAPLNKELAALEAPYRERLTEEKIAKLEPAYRDAVRAPMLKRNVEQHKLAAEAQNLIKLTWDEVLQALAPADREKRNGLRARMHELELQAPPPVAQAWTIAEAPTIPATHILKRGDPKRQEQVVEPAFPAAIGASDLIWPGRLDRLSLARWLTRPEHPLTARVMVNRIWEHHFGAGLVRTPNDFGTRGEPPTHPELLDWLACELTDPQHPDGSTAPARWSIKHLHRLMVRSSTYQQDSRGAEPEAAKKVDPDNRLLWRANRRRLEGETLRDGILAVSGALNPKQGGPMVRVPLEPEVYDLIFTEGEPDNLWPVTPDAREHTRRSIYLFAKRNVRLPLLEAFDQPDTLNSCPVRPVSTFAPQALILLNGPFGQEQSKALASRLVRECGDDAVRQIERAYRLALARAPRPAEMELAKTFLDGQVELVRERLRARLPVRLLANVPDTTDPAAAVALADFCLVLLNSNEFLYLK